MTQDIVSFITEFVRPEILENIKNDLNSHLDLLLSELGIDSLALMGVLLKIENSIDVAIDWEGVDISELNTIRKINTWIKSLVE